MAENVINGTDLYCFIEGVAIAHATTHTLSIKNNTIPTSDKETGLFGTKILGRSNVSVTCDGFVAYGDFEVIVNAKIARLPVTLSLGKKAAGTLDESVAYFEGDFIITGYEMTAADNAVTTFSVTFDHYEGFLISANEQTILVSDTFTDTDNIHLHDHVMDVGTGWTALLNYIISSNKLVNYGVGADAAYSAITEASDANVEITASFTIPNEINYLGGIALRYQDDTHYWLCQLERDAGGTPFVGLYENGVTQRGKVNITQELITDTLKVIADGNDISVYWKDMVTPLITYTSASYNTLTKHGILAYCRTGVGTYKFPIVDDFVIKNIV